MSKIKLFLISAGILLIITSCATPKVSLFSSPSDPLYEFTISGTGEEKILLIPIKGVISDSPKEGVFKARPSMVQEVVSHLNRAEKDEKIKVVVFKVDSPGGSTTASDILYHEIKSFKERTRKKIVVSMMNVAASGGYYISLPADSIMAHPTTVTGSIGVIFMRPRFSKLMKDVGFEMIVNKSGHNKDMGSPFRQTTPEEMKIFDDLTKRLGGRFISLVKENRNISEENLSKIKSARIYLAEDALNLGLIDKIGYLSETFAEAKKIAGLQEYASIITYRRTEFPDDNIYNTSTQAVGDFNPSLINLKSVLPTMQPGFYYLWMPGVVTD